jgi:MFS family permease
MTITYSIVNGTMRSVLGSLYDKFGLIVLKILASLGILLAGTIYFVPGIPGLFFIYPLLSACMLSGTTSIIPASMTKVFGIENASEVYGIAAGTYGIAALISPIISKAMNLSAATDDSIFLVLFEIGAFLSLVALIFLFIIKEETFNYDIHPSLGKVEKVNEIVKTEAAQNAVLKKADVSRRASYNMIVKASRINVVEATK